MTNTIRVLVVRVGEPSVVESMGKDLEAQQAIVGGYIEAVPFGGGLFMICNEEGKLEGLAPNFALPGDIVVGNVFFCRVDGEGETSGVTDADVKKLRAKLGR